MARKIILSVLAGIALFAVTNATFAADEQRENWRHYILHRIRPIAFSPEEGMPISQTVEANIIVVWITNDNGSITEVRLTAASGGGYTGPKGEYYSNMPTEGQLKAMYGLICIAPVRNNVNVYLGNSDGTETAVVLTKDGSGYIGPKGERYPEMPGEAELRVLYGR
jgi:hypothetical protein